MKVTKVLATTAVIPLRNVTSFSTRTVSERHYTIVKILTDDGVEGTGFCYCCLLYTSPSPRDGLLSRMPSSA